MQLSSSGSIIGEGGRTLYHLNKAEQGLIQVVKYQEIRRNVLMVARYVNGVEV